MYRMTITRRNEIENSFSSLIPNLGKKRGKMFSKFKIVEILNEKRSRISFWSPISFVDPWAERSTTDWYWTSFHSWRKFQLPRIHYHLYFIFSIIIVFKGFVASPNKDLEILSESQGMTQTHLNVNENKILSKVGNRLKGVSIESTNEIGRSSSIDLSSFLEDYCVGVSTSNLDNLIWGQIFVKSDSQVIWLISFKPSLIPEIVSKRPNTFIKLCKEGV